MAIDPSIILQAGKGVTPIESPFQLAQGAGQLAAMKQQLAMQGIQQQQAIQNMEDANAFRQQFGMSPTMAKAYHDFQSGKAQVDKANLDAAKAKIDATTALNQRQLSTLMAARDAISKTNDPNAQQRIWTQTKQTLTQNAQPYAQVLGIDTSKTDDPDQFPGLDFLDQKIATNQSYDQRLKQQQANLQAQGEWSARPAQGGFLMVNNRTGETRLDTSAKPVPPAQVTLAGLGGGAGVKAISTEDDPTKALAGLSPADQAIVKQLASRQITVGRAGGFQINNPRNQNLYALAVRLNPSLSVMDNDAAKKMMADLGSSAPNSMGGRIDSANRMLGHAGDLIDALEKLKPGSGVMGKIGNVLAYPGEKAFGSEIGPVQFIKSKLMAEVNKLVTGGVPHAEELKADIENVPITATREQWAKLIQAVANVGMEQVYAAQEKRANLLGKMDPGTSFLSSRAQAAVKKISDYAGEPTPVMGTPSGEGYTTTAITNKTPAPATVTPSQPKIMTLEDAKATAQARGMTVEQVISAARAKGWSVQ